MLVDQPLTMTTTHKFPTLGVQQPADEEVHHPEEGIDRSDNKVEDVHPLNNPPEDVFQSYHYPAEDVPANAAGKEDAFVCIHCLKGFETSYFFSGHKNREHDLISCNFCDIQFGSRQLVHQHLAKEHPLEHAFVQKQREVQKAAKKGPNKRKLPDHVCYLCWNVENDQHVFGSAGELTRHKKQAHGIRISCCLCNIEFPNRRERALHMNRFHCESIEDTGDHLDLEIGGEDDKSTLSITPKTEKIDLMEKVPAAVWEGMDECEREKSKAFLTQMEREQNIKLAHNEVCKNEPVRTTKQLINRLTKRMGRPKKGRTYPPKDLICDQCGQGGFRAEALESHRLIVHEGKGIKCLNQSSHGVCNFVCDSEEKLKRHREVKHRDGNL